MRRCKLKQFQQLARLEGEVRNDGKIQANSGVDLSWERRARDLSLEPGELLVGEVVKLRVRRGELRVERLRAEAQLGRVRGCVLGRLKAKIKYHITSPKLRLWRHCITFFVFFFITTSIAKLPGEERGVYH